MWLWAEFLGEVGSATSGDFAVVPPSCSEGSAAFRSSRSGGAWCGHGAPLPPDALLVVSLPLHRAAGSKCACHLTIRATNQSGSHRDADSACVRS